MTEDHPLVVDSRDLPRQPGMSRHFTVSTVPDADLGNDVVTVPPQPTDVDLLLESVLDGILVTGSAQVDLSGECVRCLDPLREPLPVAFRVFFTYPGAEPAAEGAETDDDIVPMTDHTLDLRPAFRDAVVLALPLTPTCRVDCPGLCPQCGARLADDPDHGHDRSDPRLAALAELRERFAETPGPQDEGD